MSELRLDARGPFHLAGALAMIAAHAIPGVEELDDTTYRRVITVDGVPALIALRLDPEGAWLTIDALVNDRASVTARVRRWLDLDADAAAIGHALAGDPVIGPLVRQRPGLRIIGYPDEFEAVAVTVIGQQVSLAAARTFAGRLAAAHGVPVGHLRAFPSAVALARVDVEELRACGLTTARARTLREVARRWADGPRLSGLPAPEARQLLLGIPGIGPWTADYVMVRGLQDPDTFAPGDLVARRALKLDQEAAALRARAWSPYRSYALLHLWADAAYL